MFTFALSRCLCVYMRQPQNNSAYIPWNEWMDVHTWAQASHRSRLPFQVLLLLRSLLLLLDWNMFWQKLVSQHKKRIIKLFPSEQLNPPKRESKGMPECEHSSNCLFPVSECLSVWVNESVPNSSWIASSFSHPSTLFPCPLAAAIHFTIMLQWESSSNEIQENHLLHPSFCLHHHCRRRRRPIPRVPPWGRFVVVPPRMLIWSFLFSEEEEVKESILRAVSSVGVVEHEVIIIYSRCARSLTWK